MLIFGIAQKYSYIFDSDTVESFSRFYSHLLESRLSELNLTNYNSSFEQANHHIKIGCIEV